MNGFAVVDGVLGPHEVNGLCRALSEKLDGSAVSRRGGGTYAARNLMDLVPAVRALANGPEVRSLLDPVLGQHAFVVRALLFDKTPGANWKVAWHQDLSIAVRERLDVPGFGPWSVKAGVQHVIPPVEVLEGMLTIRLHLDDCRADNGALRVLPGSHRFGRLSDARIQELRRSNECVCEVAPGGALLMRPLLLHASSPATAPDHRRVIHLEFAAAKLPGGLEWYEQAC